MSRTVLALLLVAVMVAPTAVAQFGLGFGVGLPGDATDFSDEPDASVPAPYSIDPNGIHAARDQTDSAPVLILNAKWVNGDASEFALTTDAGKLLAPFRGSPRLLLPLVPGEFIAYYGRWTDLNGDSHLNGAPQSQAVYVNLDSGRECGENPFACSAAREWASISGAEVVAYITPGHPVPGSEEMLAPAPRPGTPDVVFRELTNLDGDAKYVAPGDVGTFFFVDNGLAETMVMETFVDPVVLTGEARTRGPRAGEPTDVDVYRAFDPALETLYRVHVKSRFAAMGCDPERPGAFVNPADGCADVVPGVSAASLVGPHKARFAPAVEPDGGGYAYGLAPHMYFDVRLELSGYVGFGVGFAELTYSTTEARLTHGPVIGVASDGDGVAHAPVYAGVYGHLGAWEDLNDDGWIGAPTADPGCDDPYDCGANQDPNEYDSEEFVGMCRRYEGLDVFRHPNGEINATLTSSTGKWGRGVYVLTDREFFGLGMFGAPDWYYAEGNLGHGPGPYDDIVVDAADGRVDALYVEGPIPMHLNCVENDAGYYHSFEHFVFLDGGNVGYSVTLQTDSFQTDFVEAGVTNLENVFDVDVYAP